MLPLKTLRQLRLLAAQEICRAGYSDADAVEVLGINDHTTISALANWYKEVERSGSFPSRD